MKQIRKRLTYSNVMSSLAVFLVIGGGAAFAAVSNIAPNSVGTKQLKKNAVKTGKVAFEAIKAGKLSKNAVPTNRLRNNAVSTEKILDGSILTGKLGNLAVTTDKLGDSAVTTGKLGDDAVTGAKVKESTLGEVPNAANAVSASTALTPVAYAFVNEDGTVDETLSKGISDANVKLEATSAFCFRNLGFNLKTALATPAYFPPGTNGQDETAQVSKAGTGPDCAGGAQLEVATVTDSEFAPEAFQVWFFE